MWMISNYIGLHEMFICFVYVLYDYGLAVKPNIEWSVHSRPHKILLKFDDLWNLLYNSTGSIAQIPLNISHERH